MYKTKMLAGLMGVMALFTVGSAMAQNRGYGYGRPVYYHNHSGRDFVRGAIVGGVVTGLVYDATRQSYRQPAVVYSNGYAIDPTWIVTYRQSYDPYCNCSVLIRYYQDPYGNLHSYP